MGKKYKEKSNQEIKRKNRIKEQLEVLYGCRCLLTGIEDEKLTRHHIIKKEYGGEDSVENLALLCGKIHQWLHSLEKSDKELFYLINECLKLYKYCIDNDCYDLINEYETEIMPLMLKKIKPNK